MNFEKLKTYELRIIKKSYERTKMSLLFLICIFFDISINLRDLFDSVMAIRTKGHLTVKPLKLILWNTVRRDRFDRLDCDATGSFGRKSADLSSFPGAAGVHLGRRVTSVVGEYKAFPDELLFPVAQFAKGLQVHVAIIVLAGKRMKITSVT